ncbi:MAG: NAD(P)-binding domain-containing protein [Vicinamibacteria bacterium]
MPEETIVWGIATAVVAVVFVPYLVLFRKRNRRDHARKSEAVRLGTDRAAAQFPFIDPVRCIGCGACVDACPEGDVLGVVGGTATVINGLKCVGHGACETACPVGAIEVGLGDLKQRADIPLLDPWHETTVRGIFVVGELGGLALIRNAVGQGRRAVERITERNRNAPPHASNGTADVLIVGAGPAGLSAALAAEERGLSHVILEQEQDLGGTVLHYPRRKLVLVQEVDLPMGGRLKSAEYQKEELLDLMQRFLVQARLQVRFGERVEELRQEDGAFVARSKNGIHRGRNLVLALGRRGSPRKLGVPGEDLPKVMYKLLDAESYRGQRVLVVGGGDSAVEAAIGLARQPGSQVALSYRREKLVRIKKTNEERLAPLAAGSRLQLLLSSEVTEIRGDSVVVRTAASRLEIPNDYVFVLAGGEAPLALLKQIGVRFGGGGNPEPLGNVI